MTVVTNENDCLQFNMRSEAHWLADVIAKPFKVCFLEVYLNRSTGEGMGHRKEEYDTLQVWL